VLMYGPGYAMAAWPFAVYLFMLPIRVAVYATLFRAFGDTKIIAISVGLALVVNVLLSVGLTWLGANTLLAFIGPSIGVTGANLAAFAYYLWRIQRLLSIPLSKVMRWRELGQLLLLCGVCGVAVFLIPLPHLPLALKLAIQAIAYGSVLLVAVLWTGTLNEDELGLLTLPIRTGRRWLAGRRTA
jgi:O-antigen/teichoic acid export membrane protein